MMGSINLRFEPSVTAQAKGASTLFPRTTLTTPSESCSTFVHARQVLPYKRLLLSQGRASGAYSMRVTYRGAQ